MTEEEEQTHRARNRILAADSPPPPADLRERLAELRRLADLGDAAALLRAMRELVPSFRTPEPEQAAHALPGEQIAPPRQDAFDQDGTQPPTFPVPPGRA